VESSDEMPPDGPPSDPDEWSDEQWIEWLKKTDSADAAEVRPVTALGRVTHSAGGSMLGQAMLGMASALYGREENEIVIVSEGSSQPDEDKPFAVHLDPEHPERSVVVFRNRGTGRPEGETGEDLAGG
jgi:hypothetical protein